MKDQKLDFLNFDLEVTNDKSKTNELDLLLSNKRNKSNKKNNNFNNLRRKKDLRNKRIQSYVTNDVWLLIQNWKHSNNIEKNSEAIEILIKIGLENAN